MGTFAASFISAFTFFLTAVSSQALAGDFPSCPKGTVWDGLNCVSICPEGYEWNDKGKCVKKGPDLSTAAKCKKSDTFFESASSGCRHQASWLVFSQRSSTSMDFRDAARYCARIEGGKKDWRLPTAEELTAVAGETLAGSYFDFDADNYFWTSTSYQEYENEVRYKVYQKQVQLIRGYEDFHYVKTVKGQLETWGGYRTVYVVCVRADE